MLLEVLVAILVLTVGLLGLIGAFDSARKLNLLSERRTSMAHRAQLELERLQAIPYAELAMSKAPAHSTETTNPDYYVKEGSTEYQFGEQATEVESLVALASGAIAPTPAGRKCSNVPGACEWENGHVSGNVYDFVTWHVDPICKEHAENYKRLTVVVTATVPGSNQQPVAVRVSTLIVNPKQSKEELSATC